MGLRTVGVGFVAGIVVVGVVTGCGGASLAVPDSLVPLGPVRSVNVRQSSPTTVATTTTTTTTVPIVAPTTTTTEVFFVLDAPLTATTVETVDTIAVEGAPPEVPLPDEVFAENSLLATEPTTGLDGTVPVGQVELTPTTAPAPADG